MRITGLIQEAHRRSLWQVLTIYILGAWAAYEMIEALTARIGLPDWVPGFAIVLFLIGLPIVIATAFVQEGLPGQNTAGLSSAASVAGPADPTLVPDLERVDPAEQRATSSLLTPAVPHRFLTWQRSVLSGIVAFLLLGLTAGGYIGLRNAGVGPFASLITSGAMSSQDRIVIAELAHATGDSVTAAAITEALRVDLAQSRVLTVLESQFVGDALQRMGRSRDAYLDAALAREVAIREGAKAVLVGEIAPVGSGWVITARLLEASTGQQLYSRRETATGSDQMIAAVDRMSQKLREAIGESLRTVRAGAPLEAVTTSSLVALQKFTQGVRAAEVEVDYDRAKRLLEEAIAEDSLFAMAWRKLAAIYVNIGSDAMSRHRASLRAYELRDRLTDRERYHAAGMYFLDAGDDFSAAVDMYLSLVEAYPNDAGGLNNLGLAYGEIRDNNAALVYLRRALALDSFSITAWTNTVYSEYALGNRDGAMAAIDEMARRFPQLRDSRSLRASAASADGRYDEAERIIGETVLDSRGSPVWTAMLHNDLADLSLLRGRLRKSQNLRATALTADRARGMRYAEVTNTRRSASIESSVHRRPEQAVRQLNALVESAEWRAATLADRDQLAVAYEFARAGHPAMARRLASEWDAAPHEVRGKPTWRRNAVDGWIAIDEGRYTDAISAMRRAATWGGCESCRMPDLSAAFDAAGMADSAIAYRRKYLDTPDLDRVLTDAFEIAAAYERLAELYEAQGDIANAREYAGRFVDLWKDADAELQPRVRRMQDLLARYVER